MYTRGSFFIPAGIRARIRRLCALALLSLFVGPGPALAEHVEFLEPGDTLVFGAPHSENQCEEFPDLTLTVVCCPEAIAPETDRPLRAVVQVQQTPFGRATAKFIQANDFELAAGNRADTILMAQISGQASLKGFLALIGMGKVEAKLVAKVFDVTPGVAAETMVKSHVIASHAVEASFQALNGFGIEIEGGAPYLGASGGKLFNFSLEMKKEVVRENVAFGFDVLLRRDHIYRLQIELQSEAKCGGICALAIARFFSEIEEAEPPRLFEPELWRNTLGRDDTSGDTLRLPNRVLGRQSDGIFFKLFRDATAVECASDPCTTLALLGGTFGLPTTVFGDDGVVDRLLDRIGVRDKIEETIGFPGAEISGLSITVQEDEIEAIEDAAIEDKIAACISTVRLYLPAEFGGQLERVLGLVESLIEQSELAGLSTGHASSYLLEARFSLMDGNYKRSYREACKAYDAMANFSTGRSRG